MECWPKAHAKPGSPTQRTQYAAYHQVGAAAVAKQRHRVRQEAIHRLDHLWDDRGGRQLLV